MPCSACAIWGRRRPHDVGGDAEGDSLGGFLLPVACEERTTCGRLDLAVTEQSADDRQPHVERERPRVEAVADVMSAHVVQPGLRPDGLPGPVDVGHGGGERGVWRYVPPWSASWERGRRRPGLSTGTSTRTANTSAAGSTGSARWTASAIGHTAIRRAARSGRPPARGARRTRRPAASRFPTDRAPESHSCEPEPRFASIRLRMAEQSMPVPSSSSTKRSNTSVARWPIRVSVPASRAAC